MSSGGEVRIQSGDVTALVAPEYADVFDPGWFDPEFWGDRVVPVSSGGRGSAWFIDRPGQDLVLRHYRRGGMMARISERGYVFLGSSKVRSFAEFRLLQELRQLGLPVPNPVSAAYSRRGLIYSASIIIERLPGVKAWGDCLPVSDAYGYWEIVGNLIRRFHDRGVDHADLNCFNVLLSGEDGFLIDFDRSVIREKPSEPGTGWQARNLTRLRRSLAKVMEQTGEPLSTLEIGWCKFLQAYSGSVSQY